VIWGFGTVAQPWDKITLAAISGICNPPL